MAKLSDINRSVQVDTNALTEASKKTQAIAHDDDFPYLDPSHEKYAVHQAELDVIRQANPDLYKRMRHGH